MLMRLCRHSGKPGADVALGSCPEYLAEIPLVALVRLARPPANGWEMWDSWGGAGCHHYLDWCGMGRMGTKKGAIW